MDGNLDFEKKSDTYNKIFPVVKNVNSEDSWLFTDLVQWGITQKRLQLLNRVYFGWERWAQLDFAFGLMEKGVGATVEQCAYDTNQRVDIMITMEGINVNRAHHIELKAFGDSDNTTLEKFLNGVIKDIEKLKSNGRYLTNGDAWAIGLLPWDAALNLAKYKATGNLTAGCERIQQGNAIADLLYALRGSSQDWFKFLDAGRLVIVYWRAFVQDGKCTRHTDFDF